MSGLIAIGSIVLALLIGVWCGRSKWFDKLMKDIGELLR